MIADLPQVVTFTSTDPHCLPVPDPRYLALHAACACVAHLSGAGEYLSSIDSDLEAMQVLESDGSAAGLLKAALLPHVDGRAINCFPFA